MTRDLFCRLCIKEDALYHDLLENNFAQMLESLTNIKIDKNDKFSTSVCTPCLELLKTAYGIQQKILKANKDLEEGLKKRPPEKFESTNTEIKPEYVFIKEEVIEIPEDSESEQNILDDASKYFITSDELEEIQKKNSSEKDLFICSYCGEDLKNQRDLAWHRYRRHSLSKLKRYDTPLPKAVIKEAEKKKRNAKEQLIQIADETRKHYRMLETAKNETQNSDDNIPQKKFCPIILKRKKMAMREQNSPK